MRGDFEVDKSGYPIAAMPSAEVKGESYVMDVRTMNKLVDARNMPTALASHVAGVLNAGLRSKVYQSEWSKLNEASLDVYAKSIDPTETKPQEIPAIDSAATDSAEPTETQSVTGTVADQGSVQETPEPAVESTPAIVTENPQPAEQATALAAIIAEANGATGSSEANSESNGQRVSSPATQGAVPAIKPVKAPAK